MKPEVRFYVPGDQVIHANRGPGMFESYCGCDHQEAMVKFDVDGLSGKVTTSFLSKEGVIVPTDLAKALEKAATYLLSDRVLGREGQKDGVLEEAAKRIQKMADRLNA